MPAAIQWFPDMDAALVKGATAGLGNHRLADLIGVSVPVIAQRRKTLGLPPGRGDRPRTQKTAATGGRK